MKHLAVKVNPKLFLIHLLTTSQKRVILQLQTGKGAGNVLLLVNFGEFPEWPNGSDCKSAGVRLRRFESSTPHH